MVNLKQIPVNIKKNYGRPRKDYDSSGKETITYKIITHQQGVIKKSKTTARLHPSETSLDKARFNYTIFNDGSIEDIIEKVRQILITEKII